MAEVKIKFSAETAAAQKQLEELRKVGEATQKRLAEGGQGDRRTDLEALRAAKEQLAAAEEEKRIIQEKISLQAQTVRQAEANAAATAEGTKEHNAATRELQKQQSILENLKSIGTVKAQTVDTAAVNLNLARKAVRQEAPPVISQPDLPEQLGTADMAVPASALAEAKKSLAELEKTSAEIRKNLAQSSPDRRGALETLRAAKEQLAVAEEEKKVVQEKIAQQAKTVKQAQEAVKAAEGNAEQYELATRELQKQQKILADLKELGNVKGQAVDLARNNVGTVRGSLRQTETITPKVNPAPAVSGFAKIRAAASSTVAKIKSGFASASASIGKAFTGMKAAAGAALAYVGINSVKGVINELDNFSKHARSLDIDTASFQKLKYAADSNNVSFEQVESSIGKMKRTIGEAANGSAEAQKKLSFLGLTVKDLQGRTTAQQFDLIAQSITSIQDPAKRTAAAMKWFEEGGAKMLDFLKNYKQQGEELAARGAIIDDKQLKAAEDFNQSLTNISTTLKGLAVNSGFISQMTKLAELVDFAFSGKGEQAEKKAAAAGVYNRKTGAAFAAEKIIASGNYTPEQQSRIRKAAGRYGAGLAPAQTAGYGPGRVAVADYHKEYSLIDAELQKRGMGVLARQKGKWYQPAMVFGEDTTVTATQTEEEKRAAAEKLKKEKEARAAEAARKAAAQKAAAEAAAKAAEKEKSDKMDAGIKELEERYRLQQMINQGKGKEAAIEEALNRARKQAEGLGTKLTADQEQRIRTVTAASYDLSHPAKSAAAALQPSPRTPDNYVTYGLRSVGGMIAGASRAGTFSTDYTRESAQTLSAMQTQLNSIEQKLPGRTEATPVRVQF